MPAQERSSPIPINFARWLLLRPYDEQSNLWDTRWWFLKSANVPWQSMTACTGWRERHVRCDENARLNVTGEGPAVLILASSTAEDDLRNVFATGLRC